jgi:peptide/nickel transport system substrate-binding protein
VTEHSDGIGELVAGYLDRRIDRRQFMQRAIAAGASASAAAAMLAAMGSRVSASSGSGAAAASNISDQAAPRVGGTFIEGYDRDVSKMDPVVSPWADPAYNAIWERVVTMDAAQNVVNQMASEFTFSSDAKTLTIKIPAGLKFQAGTPITADIIRQDFELFRGSTGQNPPFWAPADTITAPDDTTVVVTFKTPYAAIPWTLKGEYTDIFDPAARDAAGDKWGTSVLDGSGPFTLKSWVPGEGTVVERWADYPGSTASFIENKGTSYVDAVQWVPILEAANRANELEAGNVHAIKAPLGADIARLTDNPDMTVTEFPELSNFILGLDFKATELGFDDLKVRQAISQALDRQGIVNAVLFGHGEATPGPISSAFRWYNPEVEATNKYDVEAAKALLADAGWVAGDDGIVAKGGNKLSFEVLNLNDTTGNLVMQVISDQLKAVGIDARPKNLEQAVFFSTDNGVFGTPKAFTFKWLWSSPMDVVLLFATATTLASASGKDALPDVVAAYTAWQQAADDAGLEAAAKLAQKVHADQLPYIPIYTPNAVWANSNKVHGWLPTKGNLYPYYNDVWFEE